jgi:hypothetical protein
VAAVVPIEDFNALEDAIDRYFAREADRAITGSSTRSWTSGSSSSSWGLGHRREIYRAMS